MEQVGGGNDSKMDLGWWLAAGGFKGCLGKVTFA